MKMKAAAKAAPQPKGLEYWKDVDWSEPSDSVLAASLNVKRQLVTYWRNRVQAVQSGDQPKRGRPTKPKPAVVVNREGFKTSEEYVRLINTIEEWFDDSDVSYASSDDDKTFTIETDP